MRVIQSLLKLDLTDLCWSALPSSRGRVHLCRVDEAVKHSRDTGFLMRFLTPHTVKSGMQPGCEHASLQGGMNSVFLGTAPKSTGHVGNSEKQPTVNIPNAQLQHGRALVPVLRPHKIILLQRISPPSLSVILKFVSSGVNCACQW